MDEVLKWLTPASVAVAIIIFLIKGDERSKRLDEALKKFERWIDDHMTEHRQIDNTLTKHTSDIDHNHKTAEAAHKRLGDRADNIQRDVFNALGTVIGHERAKRESSNTSG